MAKKQRTRPNPKTFTIIDKCPGCEREFGWDACQDVYVGAKELVLHEPLNSNNGGNERSVILSICPDCDCTIGITLHDNRGSAFYVPSTKDL